MIKIGEITFFIGNEKSVGQCLHTLISFLGYYHSIQLIQMTNISMTLKWSLRRGFRDVKCMCYVLEKRRYIW